MKNPAEIQSVRKRGGICDNNEVGMKLEDQVNCRIEEHRAALFKIIALLGDGQISITEARRRSRLPDFRILALCDHRP